jgi:hypothetical protein
MRRTSAAAALLHKHLEDPVGVAGKQMGGVVAGNGETTAATKSSATRMYH